MKDIMTKNHNQSPTIRYERSSFERFGVAVAAGVVAVGSSLFVPSANAAPKKPVAPKAKKAVPKQEKLQPEQVKLAYGEVVPALTPGDIQRTKNALQLASKRIDNAVSSGTVIKPVDLERLSQAPYQALTSVDDKKLEYPELTGLSLSYVIPECAAALGDDLIESTAPTNILPGTIAHMVMKNSNGELSSLEMLDTKSGPTQADRATSTGKLIEPLEPIFARTRTPETGIGAGGYGVVVYTQPSNEVLYSEVFMLPSSTLNPDYSCTVSIPMNNDYLANPHIEMPGMTRLYPNTVAFRQATLNVRSDLSTKVKYVSSSKHFGQTYRDLIK
jgi:hypothetical protein